MLRQLHPTALIVRLGTGELPSRRAIYEALEQLVPAAERKNRGDRVSAPAGVPGALLVLARDGGMFRSATPDRLPISIGTVRLDGDNEITHLALLVLDAS